MESLRPRTATAAVVNLVIALVVTVLIKPFLLSVCLHVCLSSLKPFVSI